MVWGGTSLQASRTLSAVRQGDVILRPSVRPWAGAVGPGFLQVQDKDRSHVARVCRQFLDNERISGSGRPSLSPDLDLIENLGNICMGASNAVKKCCILSTDALILNLEGDSATL